MSSTYDYSGKKFCQMHGDYWGNLCPGCNTSIPIAPMPLPVRIDWTPQWMEIADRFIAVLERIAVQLEKYDGQD